MCDFYEEDILEMEYRFESEPEVAVLDFRMRDPYTGANNESSWEFDTFNIYQIHLQKM